ncbi:MAG: GlsB/YeaQ/YmgE family stress response membrane protein [Anaerolineaceae bacterium]|nr:GlsB/YeaQ/YmgE family stress response membrane protein [Anaerolineaceae bacterium]
MGWIIVGAIAGAVARQIMGSKDQPFVNDVVLGLVGSIVGGFVAGLLGIARPDGGLDRVIINLIISIVGAIILIYIGRLIRGRR